MRPIRVLALAAAAAFAIAGCAAQGPDRHNWNTSYDYGVPGQGSASYASVAYYPACSNEILNFDGRAWFPFMPSNAADFPSDPLLAVPASLSASGAQDEAGLMGGAGPIGAVVAPGPGDDVGTLVIYENGLAYWQADSGGLHTWLTNHKIEYNWAC